MIAAACAMASALLTLIFSTIAFQLSIESRLKMVHQAEILQYLEEAVIAQEERIWKVEVKASRPELPSGRSKRPVQGVEPPYWRREKNILRWRLGPFENDAEK